MRRSAKEDTLRFVCGPEYKDIIKALGQELELFGRTNVFDIDPEWHCISRNNRIYSNSLGWTRDELRENKIKVHRVGPDVYILELPKPHKIDAMPENAMEILFDATPLTDCAWK